MSTTTDQEAIPAMRFERKPNLDIRFPPLPRTVAEVSQLLAQSEEAPDVGRLADIIEADPVIAAAVLRRINSAYYGMRRRISSIRKAVFLLGFLEVSNLTLTAGFLKLGDVLESEEQHDIFKHITKVSIGAASFSQFLATELKLPSKSTAFTLGLVHAIGRLVLLHNKPDDYEALWYTNDVTILPTAHAERCIFGTDHAELGARAATDWHLPEVIAKSIRWYLDPEQLDLHLRPQALALSASVDLTDHLLTDQASSNESAVEASDALHALAAMKDVSFAELTERIEGHYDQAEHYIEMMISDA